MRKDAFFAQTGHTLIEVILAISVSSIILLLITEVVSTSGSWLVKLTNKVNHLHDVSTSIVLLKKAYHSSKHSVILIKPDPNMKITRRGQGKYVSGQILKSNGIWYIGLNAQKQKELYRFKDRYRRKMVRLDAFNFNLKANILKVSLSGKVYSVKV